MQASIAERTVWGRPYDPVAHDTYAPVVPRSGTALIGRILLSAIFLLSGFAKLADPAGAIGYMQGVGINSADKLVYVSAFAEIAGGLALLFGFLTRLGAYGLIVYLVIVTGFFHRFWSIPEAEAAKTQMVNFMKNLGILGGLFTVAAFGPGRYSIDARIRRPKAA